MDLSAMSVGARIRFLREEKRMTQSELAALTAVEDKTGLVADISPNPLLNDIKRTCRRAGVTEVGNHGLRHSFASLGYHLRISERQLMKWGGWADYQTMHRIYIRLADKDETAAQANVMAFFAPADQAKTG